MEEWSIEKVGVKVDGGANDGTAAVRVMDGRAVGTAGEERKWPIENGDDDSDDVETARRDWTEEDVRVELCDVAARCTDVLDDDGDERDAIGIEDVRRSETVADVDDTARVGAATRWEVDLERADDDVLFCRCIRDYEKSIKKWNEGYGNVKQFVRDSMTNNDVTCENRWLVIMSMNW